MSEWIEWKGGDCPVSAWAIVEIRTRATHTGYGTAAAFRWRHNGSCNDVVRYRVVGELPKVKVDGAPDNVNSPAHYTAGDIECIDAIEAALTPEEFRGYCKGNALKYIWRERHKGGAESIDKAGWYLKRLEAK